MNKLLFIFCIIVFLFKTQTVFSSNLIYDVNNVEVNGKINKDSDKKKLIQSAFKKAFVKFVNKTLLRKDALNFYKTKINVIEDLVFAYQIVKDSKDDANERTLIVNIKFDPKKINNFLAKKKVSYADVSNISLTMLPVIIKDEEVFLFSENFFFNNWIKTQNQIKNNTDILITYNLALENIEDFQFIISNKENLESIDIKNLTSFDDQQNFVFLIVYSSDNNLKAYMKIYIENKGIDKNLNLNVYPNFETKTYEEAITTIKQEINQIWKSQNLIDVNTPTFLDLFLEIKKTNDYLKLSKIFDSIDLIENYSVLEMTNKHTKVRLKYKGKLNKLTNKLLENKMKIKIENNIWIAVIK